MTDVVIVLTTVPEGDLGDTIARRLIEQRVAACVNVCAPMTSLYRWRGAVERETERQLVIKTTREHVPEVQACIAELHSYRPQSNSKNAVQFFVWLAEHLAVGDLSEAEDVGVERA